MASEQVLVREKNPQDKKGIVLSKVYYSKLPQKRIATKKTLIFSLQLAILISSLRLFTPDIFHCGDAKLMCLSLCEVRQVFIQLTDRNAYALQWGVNLKRRLQANNQINIEKPIQKCFLLPRVLSFFSDSLVNHQSLPNCIARKKTTICFIPTWQLPASVHWGMNKQHDNVMCLEFNLKVEL